VTYGDLNRRANQLARFLGRLGIGRGAPVALCMERSVEVAVGPPLGPPVAPPVPPVAVGFDVPPVAVGFEVAVPPAVPLVAVGLGFGWGAVQSQGQFQALLLDEVGAGDCDLALAVPVKATPIIPAVTTVATVTRLMDRVLLTSHPCIFGSCSLVREQLAQRQLNAQPRVAVCHVSTAHQEGIGMNFSAEVTNW